MAFPPKKVGSSPPPKKAGPPSGGPPDPFGGGAGPGGPPAPGGDPNDPFGGMGGGPPMMGGGPPGMVPGMPKPGQGMDPMQAMLQGIGPDPLGLGGGPSAGPAGPMGLPIGGSMPQFGQDDDGDMGGSPLLQTLMGSLQGSQGGDQYQTAPMEPGQGFEGMGTGDPNMGLQQMLQLFMLGQMGVGGGPPQQGLGGHPGADLGGPMSTPGMSGILGM